jgi:ankyrin repeat protein
LFGGAEKIRQSVFNRMSTGDWINILIARFLLKPTDLWRVALAGNVKGIRQLVDSGTNLNAKTRFWTFEEALTPLHVAVYYRRVKSIKELVKLGAKIDAKDENGDTPLMYAVNHGDIKIACLLLELGADVNLHNRNGKTAIDGAAIIGDLQLVKMLLAHGAEPNHEIKGKRATPIVYAACSNNLEVLKLLLEKGASVKNYFGCDREAYTLGPPLNAATLNGNSEFVRLLIENGADPNATDENGFTSVMMAIRGKEIEILEMLIRAGADLNAKDAQGRTALSIAKEEQRETKLQRIFWIIVTKDLSRYKKLDCIIQKLLEAGTKR